MGAVSLGHAPNGKRRRPKVYGKAETEVHTKTRDLKKEMQTGVKSPANCTVAEAVNDWLERGLKGRDEKTVSKNRTMADKHLIPLIGKAKPKDLSADEVDDWLDDRAEWLATRSLRDLLAVLRRSIAHAQRRDKAVRNVALLVTVPEGRPGRPSKALNLKQAKAVLAAARGSRHSAGADRATGRSQQSGDHGSGLPETAPSRDHSGGRSDGRDLRRRRCRGGRARGLTVLVWPPEHDRGPFAITRMGL